MYATHTTPHAVHVSFRAVCVQMDWGNHVCHTHHMQCTFPSEQFLSRWTGAIMYATHTTHTTRSARFLQTSSCPDGLGQILYATHTTCSARFLQTSSFVSRWTEAIMYATHTTRSACFLQSSSCPDGLRQSCIPHAVHVSFRPVPVQMD